MASEIVEGLLMAIGLIIKGDTTLIEITIRSLAVSSLATIFACLWSIPLGAIIGIEQFRGRGFLKGLFNTLLGIPTVTLGLILYLVLSRSGPFGSLHLLYSPIAIVLGQSILITPIIVSFVANSLEEVDPDVKNLALTLGASEFGAKLTVLGESLGSVVLVITASFNRAIAELGVALMLGGNIRGVTRVLTTTIALETGRGEISLSIALTFVLLTIVATVNSAMNLVKRRI